jgi:hypothetical protein
MNRAIMVVWMVLVPVVALEAAQDAGGSGEQAAVQQTPSQPRQPLPPPPPPEPEPPRRRGSMVGYIEDEVISSKVRIRFDVGFEINTPDRAEFFYAKCGCYRDGGADPDAPGPRPGAAIDLDYRQLYVQGEYAFTDRVSAYAEFPFRWLEPNSFAPPSIPPGLTPFGSQSGASDLRAGVKVAIASGAAHVVTGRLQAFVPTGEASRGLGTDHWSIEPALLVYNRLTERVSVESQVGWWHPFEGASGRPLSTEEGWAGDVFFYGIGPSFEVYRGDRVRFAPVVELVGWHVVNGFQSAPPFPPPTEADGTNIVNLKIGARTSWDPRSSFYIGFGKALTDAVWYDEILRFEYRLSF